MSVVGTPLKAWPAINASLVEELKYFKVFTVEQLADLPDNLSQNFIGINAWKQKAKSFMEAASGLAAEAKTASELAKRDAQINALTEAVSDLTQMVKELRKGKGGSQPKAVTDAEALVENLDEIEGEIGEVDLPEPAEPIPDEIDDEDR
jgi:ABC-type transporter Mla subunit MlaD